MTWFKVDDSFATHPKVLAAGNNAIGLWVRAGAWAAAQLTDGFIPHSAIGLLGGRKRDAEKLCTVGLWAVENGGYRFHDWDQFQPSRDQTLTKRRTETERKAAWRERTRGQDGKFETPSQNGHRAHVSRRDI